MNLKSVEKKEKGTAVLTVEVDAKEFDAAVEKVYRKAKGQISIPGFRRGKAPRKLIEKMYGTNVFYEDAVNDLYPKALSEALEEADLTIVGYPTLKVEHIGPEGFLFTATVGLKPEAVLGQYKGVECPKDTYEVTDEDVENELRPLIERASTQETVERPLQDGDSAVIDFEGFKDGVAFEGGKAEQYTLKIGSGQFIPGFEEQLVGMSAGEDREINVTFPEDYGAEDLAGAAVVFRVHLHEVKENQVPELDDEFAKDVSEFDTLDELKADLRAKVEKRKSDGVQNAFEAAVIAKVIADSQMEVPDTMVEFDLDRELNSLERRVAGYGMDVDRYLEMMGTNRVEFRENRRADALLNIQRELVLEAVAKAEGLEVSEEELNAELTEMAENYEVPLDEFKGRVDESAVRYNLRLRKAAKLVCDSAVATQP